MNSKSNQGLSGELAVAPHQRVAFATPSHKEFLRGKSSDEIDGRPSSASTKLAYLGLFLFTFLLYARPQEMFSEALSSVPIVKIVACASLFAYFMGKLTAGERLTIWPLELWMVLAIVLLSIVFTPIAASPQDSLDVLLDTFLKVVIIFVLMINLLSTNKRLQSIIKLSVICGSALAVFAIFSYATGNFSVKGQQSTGRVAGLVEGMFDNPNDLAIGLNLLLPLSVALALMSRDWKRILYFICTGILTIGVVVTFSRGGFLGLVALGLLLLWKLSKRNRGLTILAFLIVTGLFMVAMPAGYSTRITTIFFIDEDPTGSAQARRELLNRGMELAVGHPIIGLGMGNFHTYSIQEQVAHNSYLEISSELGVAGLIAYLILILSPMRSLRRIERQTRNKQSGVAIRGRDAPPEHDAYYLSVALQASIIAYMVCTFFASVEYLWYVYYPVAYSVGLRQIYAFEQIVQQPVTVAAEKEFNVRRNSGILWKPHQRASGITRES